MSTTDVRGRAEILGRIPAFSRLGASELEQLAEVAHKRTLKPREELFHKGDEGSQVYVIVDGRLRIGATYSDGTDMQFTIQNPGDVCGELALFGGGERTATATAVDECELLSLDRRDFLPFLRKNPDVAIHLIEALVAMCRRLSEQIEDTIFLDVRSRLAKKLLALASDYGEDASQGQLITMRLSQAELGTMVGTSRESVNKQMRAWEDEGLVQSERGHITLLRVDALEGLAEGLD